MKLYQNIFLVLGLLLSFSLNAQKYLLPSESESFKQDFKKHVLKKMKRYNVTGLSIALEIEGQHILEAGFGFSDKSGNVRATKDTEYPIGSVSKIITSTAILKLCTDGLIDIDKKYTYYVRDFSMKSHFNGQNEFTIRHLLSHYAGIPRLRAKGFMKKEPKPLEDLLLNSKDEYLISPPGRVYQYSDWGVDLLSLLVERVSGVPYEEYVENHIFKPLNMDHSYFGPAKYTKGYNNGRETETYKYSYSGSDGVTSSASDMLKIVRLYTNEGRLSSKQFLSYEVVKDALQNQFIDAPLAYDTGIGLMWDVQQLKNGRTRIKKAGVHEPFFTYIFFIPELQASIVICSNSNSSSSIHWDSWGRLYSFLAEKYNLANHESPSKKRAEHKKVTLTDDQFKKIEGSYSTSIGILNFKRNGNKFDVDLKSENKRGVGVPYSGGLIKLYIKAFGIKIHAMDVFWEEVNGEIIMGKQFKSGSRHVSGSKIDSRQIPVTWKNAIGTYRVINYDENDYKTFDSIRLFINSDDILEIRGDIKFPRKIAIQLGLSPVSDELAIIPGYNFDFFGGETVKLQKKKDGGYYLTLSGCEFKRISK
ncbi:serine hydrolase domain-containing protein [Fulvivirgaceae bacterium BMA12]|uniref:Serine hydrolase domain-containing protein n=1 Tax=Agaribacillus aureus TaxID=3051825 RepID=A0ABT8L8R1_9BACT|nr:serine hydrolase domain-containing protein [Fulvivirgaceae bacterium BMA12]